MPSSTTGQTGRALSPAHRTSCKAPTHRQALQLVSRAMVGGLLGLVMDALAPRKPRRDH